MALPSPGRRYSLCARTVNNAMKNNAMNKKHYTLCSAQHVHDK